MRWLTWGILVGILLILIAVFRKYKQRKTQINYENNRRNLLSPEDSINTIFVSIPCYEDEKECAQTLFELFNKARCPWRITAGVFHHQAPTAHIGSVLYSGNILNLYSQLCVVHQATDFSDHIRIHIAPSTEAQGPMAARAYIEQHLFQRERYYMTMDSHMQLTLHWDARVLTMYSDCQQWSSKPILTTFPGNYDRLTRLPVSTLPTYVAVQELDNEGYPIPLAQYYDTPPKTALATLFWVPCFSFASSRLITEVPMLATLAYLFYPEMYVQSARYWTQGWDFFTPAETVVYHLLDRDYRPTYWEQLRQQGVPAFQERNKAFQQAATVLRSELGSARTLQAFEHYCGVTVGVTPTSQAQLGCTMQPSDAEIIAKFGSQATYSALQQKIKT